MSDVEFQGGEELEKLFKQAKKTARSKGYRVGFFSSAKYPNGTSVALVAAYNEFGMGVPERAFFRMANKRVQSDLIKMIKRELEGGKPLTSIVVQRMAEVHKGAVQTSITELDEPPNAPATIKKKKSSNPLIDTGFMRTAVSWEEER